MNIIKLKMAKFMNNEKENINNYHNNSKDINIENNKIINNNIENNWYNRLEKDDFIDIKHENGEWLLCQILIIDNDCINVNFCGINEPPQWIDITEFENKISKAFTKTSKNDRRWAYLFPNEQQISIVNKNIKKDQNIIENKKKNGIIILLKFYSTF